MTDQQVSTGSSLKTAVYFLTLLTILLLVGTFFFLASISVWWTVEEQEPIAALLPPPSPTATNVPTQVSTKPASAELAPTFTAFAPVAPPTAPTILAPMATVVKTAVPTPTPEPFGTLIIPDIEVNQSIIPIFVRDGQWDISEIGNRVGHLETTGRFPGDQLAMTFTGHVTLPWPEISGPFADLVFLERGEEIIYRWNGMDYVYQVERIFRAEPAAVDLLYEDDGEKLILVTCSGWDFTDRLYAERLVTHAVLVRQEPTSQNLD